MLHKSKQEPINLQSASKSDVRTQFAALCFREKDGKTQLLLITSRGSGRWIIPRGWPMDNKTPCEAALIEAWEEAGVRGKAYGTSLGLYSYTRDIGEETRVPCVAMIYPVKVKSLARDFPEAGQRKRKWLSPKKAAESVNESELAHILKAFDAKNL
ncbi:NUDIX hydrolase [Roseovarius aestuarii]|uniref:NUDIX domain protein n=1 Tax=Roseovarius aestuarii TaxID=475083 RepID=A0A1X7BSX4_9RHOB|nr:NUDIX hydrolase [Roseovarius aestuarii]SMC12630.1 NUDIX domain protein [Roseovarius aestuarii]